MQDNLFGNFADKAKNMYEPLSKFNALMMANLGKVAEFQMDAIKSYADLTMKQLKEVTQVRDIESLKNFGAGQADFAGSIAKKMMEDFKTLGEMGTEFKDEAEKIFKAAQNGAAEAEAESTEKSA